MEQLLHSRPKVPTTDEMRADMDRLRSILMSGAGKWMNSSEIARLSAGSIAGFRGWNKRQICEIAEHMEGEVIATFQGYKLDIHASEADVLSAYSRRIRMALGAEAGARKIIANARRKGFLWDPGTEHRIIAQIRDEIQTITTSQTNTQSGFPTQCELF